MSSTPWQGTSWSPGSTSKMKLSRFALLQNTFVFQAMFIASDLASMIWKMFVMTSWPACGSEWRYLGFVFAKYAYCSSHVINFKLNYLGWIYNFFRTKDMLICLQSHK
jgi:hypothetical protein